MAPLTPFLMRASLYQALQLQLRFRLTVMSLSPASFRKPRFDSGFCNRSDRRPCPCRLQGFFHSTEYATFAPENSDVMWASVLRSAPDGSIDSSFSSELHGILRSIA